MARRTAEPVSNIAPRRGCARAFASALAATLVLALLPGDAAAETPSPAKPPGCTAAAASPVRLLAGRLGCRPTPKARPPAATGSSSLHDGCVLQENWSGTGGFTGTSLNAYDAERKAWHQTWVDNSGGVLQLDGASSTADGVRRRIAGRGPEGDAADYVGTPAGRARAAALGVVEGRRDDLDRRVRRLLREALTQGAGRPLFRCGAGVPRLDGRDAPAASAVVAGKGGGAGGSSNVSLRLGGAPLVAKYFRPHGVPWPAAISAIADGCAKRANTARTGSVTSIS